MERQRAAGVAGRMMMALMSLCMLACTDDWLADYERGAATEATPVRFVADCVPLHSMKRAAPQPRKWQDGDVIQILARFAGEGMAADEDTTQYGCYKYSGGDWLPAEEESDLIFWPVGSDSATFRAYYVEGCEGRITEGDSVCGLLGDIEEGGDPLCAEASLRFGHSVSLSFRHLCTHLKLKDVKADNSEGYWLYRADGTEIPNAYKLSYAGGDGLKFEFTKSDQCRTDGTEDGNGNEGRHYYILRQRDRTDGSVDFYLAQETGEDGLRHKYGICELAYRFNRPYLSFKDVKPLDSLESGTHYEFSIEKQLGIVPLPETDFPEEPEANPGDVDIPTLLDGIVSGKDVKDKNGNVVLKVEGEPYPRLLRDVDFKNFNPMDYIEAKGDYEDSTEHKDWKLPVLDGTFDGNFHSFLHVAYPIFDKIEGKIYNLAIRDSKCDITVEDIQRMEKDHIRGGEQLNIMTDFGLLACDVSGQLDKILLDSVAMTVHLDDTLSSNTQNRAYRIGCLAGNQEPSSDASTVIGNVKLWGEVKLTVTTDDDGALDEVQDCYIGAMVGQAGALIDGVTTSATGKCTVSTPIKGQSTVYVGGLVGRLTGGMRNAELETAVDCSELCVVQAYAGGLCGEVADDKNNGQGTTNASLEDCNAVVNVKGGTVQPINTVTYAHAYAGGIAARISSAGCSGVSVAGSVSGGIEASAVTNNSNMINYATGGGFGYITGEEETDITDCKAETDVTAADVKTEGQDNNNTGTFVGLCDGLTEEELQNAGNSAREIEGLQFVGKEGSEPGNSN